MSPRTLPEARFSRDAVAPSPMRFSAVTGAETPRAPAARDVHDTVNKEFNETRAVIAGGMSSLGDASDPPVMTSRDPSDPTSHYAGAMPAYKPPKKNWRVKRAAVPAWCSRMRACFRI